MMTLYYEGSDGTIINFMGDGVFAQSPETLTESVWSYNTILGVNGLGRVKRFYKDLQEFSLTVGVMTDSEADFNSLMYKMHRTFDRDIRRLKPGKLWWNGFYKEVFAIESSHDSFEEFYESIDKTIKFISTYPYWVQKKTMQYISHIGNEGSFDYNGFDYDNLDYDQSEFIEIIENDCIESANFKLTFYGPAINPSVTIGEHEYTLFTELKSGEYATVDSITKKIIKYSIVGQPENIFHTRNKQSYIFEKIPEGSAAIVRSRELSLDITIFDERGEPKWI